MSQATWEVTRFKAENDFEAVRNLAEMNKQAAMAVAMKLSMPSHLTAVRAAEKAYRAGPGNLHRTIGGVSA
jgi:hypothetical protein